MGAPERLYQKEPGYTRARAPLTASPVMQELRSPARQRQRRRAIPRRPAMDWAEGTEQEEEEDEHAAAGFIPDRRLQF